MQRFLIVLLSLWVCTCEPSLWGKACDEQGRCLPGYVCNASTNRCVRPDDLPDGSDGSDDSCSVPCTGGCPAAGCCTQECIDGNCPNCTQGCSCDFTCRDANQCSADCPDGSDCHLTTKSGSRSDMTCDGASCTHECDSASHCTLSCSGQSSCDLICDSTGSCELACGEEAACLMSCRTGTCTFTCSDPVDCGNGVQVCRRACP